MKQVSNWIIMSGCTAVFPSSLLDDEPMTLGEAAQPVDPNSLDQLLHFTEDGISRADGDWSMDYWNPYGLDEGLLGSVAMGVPTSTQPEATPPVCVSHDVASVFRPASGILSQIPLSHTSLYGGGNAPPSVWIDLDAIDRLVFELETENRGTVLPPPLATSPPHHTAGVPPPSIGDGALASAAVQVS
uniref:Uncharacterized protein n=1 Tax=Timema cristinae TaxID=61476 RepID=A0A7R9DN37_TIMCR|nr:unnamed protein product [Timema cristinae]